MLPPRAPRASPYCTNNPMDRASTACLSRCRARRSALFNNWRCESFFSVGGPRNDMSVALWMCGAVKMEYSGGFGDALAIFTVWPPPTLRGPGAKRPERSGSRFLARSFVPTGLKLEGAHGVRTSLGGKYLQSGDGCSVRCLCDRRRRKSLSIADLCGNQIYGAFVLNRRVDLHAIDATPAREHPTLVGFRTVLHWFRHVAYLLLTSGRSTVCPLDVMPCIVNSML